ncbi:MAG: succinate dehydrogenase cytochrome b subunit [Nitrospinota bacterium]
MSRFARLCQTSIGAKQVMAVTGLLLFGFIIGHLVGNLLVFAGRDALNAYARKLRELGALLWVVRLALLAVFFAHVGSALRLWRLNRAARPQPYAVAASQAATYAGRTIVMSGLLILLYLIYHLMHLTLGVTNPEYLKFVDAKGLPDVYRMMVTGFSKPAVSGVYIAAMILLGLHLSHGLTSFFQTVGLNHPAYNACFRRAGPVAGVAIAAGYIAIPLAVLAGLLKLP